MSHSNPSKGCIYYTDNWALPDKYAIPVRKIIRDICAKRSMELVSCTLKPTDMGKNIVLDGERGYLTMFRQILTALEASTSDIIFFCEHDVLYPEEHFDFTPPRDDTFYYDVNWWKIRPKDGYAVHWDADQVSGLCVYRDLAIEWYRKRVAEFDPENFDRKFEPSSGEKSEQWKAPKPHIDIRWGHNLTYDKWTLDHFRKKETAVNFETSTIDQIPNWDNLRDLIY